MKKDNIVLAELNVEINVDQRLFYQILKEIDMKTVIELFMEWIMEDTDRRRYLEEQLRFWLG